MRSVCLRYDNGQPLSSVSLSPDQNFVATGCGSHVGVISLGENGAREHINIQLKATGRFTVTDVDFSPQTHGGVAASGTNGMIAVFDFQTGQEKSRSRYSCLWDSGETPPTQFQHVKIYHQFPCIFGNTFHYNQIKTVKKI